MHFQETIFCATSSSSGPGSITVHDIQTGASLASFKQTNAAINSTAYVQSSDGQGGFILAAQQDKSIMNVYNFQKDQLTLKIVLPEKLTCIAVDRTGDFCAGGTAQGRIYVWEVASGILYNSWDAHYRQVTVLKFTLDGSALLSGSEDSGVSVWSMSRLLDDEIKDELPMPYCSLSDHTLPVTDIICGVGPFPACRVLTSSVDHSVKLWDLSSRSLLTTFQFPQPITSLAWENTERLFFAASTDGSIHQMNLFRQRDETANKISEAIGGAGISDIIRLNDDDYATNKKRLILVGSPITTLTISLTSTLLLVGTSTGLIHIYDIASHQLLRTISTHKGFEIACLATMLKPPDLVGHVSLSMSVGGSAADARDVIPVKPVAPLQRMRDPKTREAHDIAMLLPTQTFVYEEDHYSNEELIRDHAYFVEPSVVSSTTTAAPNSSVLQSRIGDLESEVARLREQLGKAKGVNDVMWETVVQKVVGGQGKEKKGETGDASEQPMEVDNGERRRKRGRT